MTDRERDLQKIRDKLALFECDSEAVDDLVASCEREVAVEVHDEKEYSSPPKPARAEHEANKNLEMFITTGLLRHEDGFQWAFESLATTTLGNFPEMKQFPRDLRVTDDFAQVVDLSSPTDKYQQHVEHVLITKSEWVDDDKDRVAVIISDYEANKHWQKILDSDYVDLYSYVAKSTPEEAQRCDHLVSQTGAAPSDAGYPPRIRIALDLFAGQLYFGTMEEYQQTCSYLDLAYFDKGKTKELTIGGDLFISGRYRKHIPAVYTEGTRHWGNFKTSPVPFLTRLIVSVRNHGGSIEHTHMGKLLNGEILTEMDFKQNQPMATTPAGPKLAGSRCGVGAGCKAPTGQKRKSEAVSATAEYKASKKAKVTEDEETELMEVDEEEATGE